MVFGIISRTKTCSATNEVSKCRSPERALLRHNTIGVQLLTSARRAKMQKKVALIAIMHVKYWQQPTFSSEDRQLRKAKNYKRHCLRLNHAMHAITSSDGDWAPKDRSRSWKSMKILSGSCIIGKYVGGWVCIVIVNISRTKSRSATNEVPKCRSQ